MNDYNEYSLRNLKEWIHDSISAETPPNEIYNAIVDVVVENRDYHRQRMIESNELLMMMRGNRPVKMEHKYTDEELNNMCDDAEKHHSKYYYDFDRNSSKDMYELGN